MEVVIRQLSLEKFKPKNVKKNLYIAASCHIVNNEIFFNRKLLLKEDPALPFAQFAKKIYKDRLLKYPKFFKMDRLSKLVFLGAEFLFKESRFLHPEGDNKVAVVLSNRASSLDTDRKHQASIANEDAWFPSPAVFVYTLPNIGIGEICIRHQLYSENAFFIFDAFNAGFLEKYATALIHNQKENSVLCGWVDYDENDYEAFLYLVAEKGTIPHTAENINYLYKVD